MINHYVNLVCWEALASKIRSGRDIFWCDSITMLFTLRLFGKKAEYRPGTKVASTLTFDNKQQHVFGAKYIKWLPASAQTVLPVIEDVESFEISEELIDVLRSLDRAKRIYVGIGSPKQNLLAIRLHEIRPDLEYHCLGAAIPISDHRPELSKFKLIGSGFEWLRFLFIDRRRTYTKIMATLTVAITLLLDRSKREKFFIFAQYFEGCAPSTGDNGKRF